MLKTDELEKRLVEIDTLYLQETDPIKIQLWAKLATIEVGGWTEECIDKMITDYVIQKNPPSKEKILDRLSKVYGFNYKTEFRSIVVELIGSILFDKIENDINLSCQQLESALAQLKKSRDTSAHTYTKVGTTIDSPSKSLDLLRKISKGLTTFNDELQKLQI